LENLPGLMHSDALPHGVSKGSMSGNLGTHEQFACGLLLNCESPHSLCDLWEEQVPPISLPGYNRQLHCFSVCLCNRRYPLWGTVDVRRGDDAMPVAMPVFNGPVVCGFQVRFLHTCRRIRNPELVWFLFVCPLQSPGFCDPATPPSLPGSVLQTD
jgi:hypothetical protein